MNLSASGMRARSPWRTLGAMASSPLLAPLAASVREVLSGRADGQSEIARAIEFVADADLLQAKARLVARDGFCVPQLVDNGPLRLRGARHPLMLRKSAALADGACRGVKRVGEMEELAGRTWS